MICWGVYPDFGRARSKCAYLVRVEVLLLICW